MLPCYLVQALGLIALLLTLQTCANTQGQSESVSSNASECIAAHKLLALRGWGPRASYMRSEGAQQYKLHL